MIDCIVTTSIRPNDANYLQESLLSIKDGGFDNVWIAADGPLPRLNGFFQPKVMTPTKIGIVPFYRLCLSYMIEYAQGDRFIVFQDDVQVCPNCCEWIERHPLKEDHIFSLYTNKWTHDFVFAKPKIFPPFRGWDIIPLSPTDSEPHPSLNALGGCAIMFTKDAARKLIETRPPVRTDRLGAWIAEFAYHSHQMSLWAHNPSIVQHIGVQGYRGSENHNKKAVNFATDLSQLDK